MSEPAMFAFPFEWTNKHKDTISFHGKDVRHGDSVFCPGMSLRDYFAAQAMIGLVSTTSLWSHDEDDTGIASSAYAIADAMLAERAK